MRIGFNAQIISSPDAGVAIYARNLLKALAEISAPDEILAFGSESQLSADTLSKLRMIRAPSGRRGWLRVAWEQTMLPFRGWQHGVDVMFYPDHTAPLLKKFCPVIVTIHDVAFLAYPHTFRPLRRMYKSFAIQRSIHQADAIVVVSEATKRECLEYLNVDDAKLHVIHNGLDPYFSVVKDRTKLQDARRKYTLPERYILFVGTLEPRKNVAGLLQAFARLSEDVKLVIVGMRGWLYKDVFRLVKELNIHDRVNFLGHVPYGDLLYLYNLAELFVYPSLYEGFGFPPLEAMACGVPVITSNSSSIPEVVGDGAILIDPRDTDSLAKAMRELLENSTLRQALKQRGLLRAREFTWRKTAAGVLQVCRQVVSSKAA